MGKLTTVGVDLAKDVIAALRVGCAWCGYRTYVFSDATRSSGGQNNCRQSGVAMEACGSAHHWGRWFAARGHTARLDRSRIRRCRSAKAARMTPQTRRLSPLPLGNRRCASCRSRPSISKPFSLGTACARAGRKNAPHCSTGCAVCSPNTGIVIGRSADRFLTALPKLTEDSRLPDPMRALLLEAREQFRRAARPSCWCDAQIAAHARSSPAARRAANCSALARSPRSALAATVPDAKVLGAAASLARGFGAHAATAQLRRQDPPRTDQLARQRLSAHPADSRPQYAAGSDQHGASASQSIAALDHRALRPQGLLQDVDRHRQQACPRCSGPCSPRTNATMPWRGSGIRMNQRRTLATLKTDQLPMKGCSTR